MGKGMILLSWVLLLGLLTMMFNGLLQQRYNPNRDPQALVAEDGSRAVVLERNAQGHYVASGSINGYPVTFLLDTGATDVAIPGPLADRLGLDRQRGGFSRTANGVVAVWRTRLDEVRLGPIAQRSVAAVILPNMGVGGEVLLGMSFLKHLQWRQEDGRLMLYQ